MNAITPSTKRRLLWHSNSPLAPTGYGNQVNVFAPLLAKHYDLAVSAFYGLEGSPIYWQDIQILPGETGTFGNEYLMEHARNFFRGDVQNGLVMTLCDVWVIDHRLMRELHACAWVPVDHDPAPPGVMNYFAQSGAVPLAMSQFGMERLEQFNPIYVPHGVDVDTLKPRPKLEAREKLGWSKDAFIVGMVAANQGRPARKSFQQAFEAFAHFRKTHEDAILYLHTQLRNPEGEDLMAMLDALGIPDESVIIASQYHLRYVPFPMGTMSGMYSALDVLLNPSMGEGFGIPMMEAQACGTPVIATDFSAMKEVVGAGWKVNWSPFWTAQKSWQATPYTGDIVGALEECYGMNSDAKRKLSKKARTHALKYAAPKVLEEHFLPALAEVEERLWKPKVPKVPAKIVA